MTIATRGLASKDPTSVFSAQLIGLTAFDRVDALLAERVGEHDDVLTPREQETLWLAAAGMSSKEMARALKVSDRTVEFHMRNVATKLGASNKTHAVAKAIAMGLIDGSRLH